MNKRNSSSAYFVYDWHLGKNNVLIVFNVLQCREEREAQIMWYMWQDLYHSFSSMVHVYLTGYSSVFDKWIKDTLPRKIYHFLF